MNCTGLKIFLFLWTFLFLGFTMNAQDSIFGQWKTIDEATGKPKAVVEIFDVNGKAQGRIIKHFRSADQNQDPVCDKCTGNEKGKKVIGLEIIKDMQLEDDEWEDGTILDAESGKVYDCKMWLEEGKLMVRGYIAFFFRTQEWLPYSGQ